MNTTGRACGTCRFAIGRAAFAAFGSFIVLAGCSEPLRSANEQVPNTSVANNSINGSADPSDNMITLQSLEEMFSNMKAKAPWYRDGDLLWGYFFTDPDAKKLERAAERLRSLGYRFVNIHPTDDATTNFLHVEKIERHTPQTLHQRNGELYALADEFDLESYDGMDVGPVLSE